MSQRERADDVPDEVAAFLEASRRVQVATINPDGTPHVVPMSYVVIDGLLTIWTDPRSRKVVNLRRDPRITCLVEDGTTFAELRAVQLYGRAEFGEDRETSLRDRAGVVRTRPTAAAHRRVAGGGRGPRARADGRDRPSRAGRVVGPPEDAGRPAGEIGS